MVEVNIIRCFLSLAETLSFTLTAKALYMTQQAVSKHISHIEEEFGFPLFIRSRRSVSLTPEGEECYKLFSKFMAEYDAFLNEARAAHKKNLQTIRIGIQNRLNFGMATGRALTALQESKPQAELIVECHSPGILNQRLLGGDLDLIIIHKRFMTKAGGLKLLELIQTPLLVMTSIDHPLGTPDATYKTFAHEPFLIDVFESESPGDSLFRAHQYIKLNNLTPDKVIVLPNRDSIYMAVELGQGITLGTEMSQIPSIGAIKSYPTDVMETLVCVWREGQENSAVEEYANCLKKEHNH